jgi:hypothetical protein
MTDFEIWRYRAERAQSEVDEVLSTLGGATARIKSLGLARARLIGAPVDVQEYFDEAIVCLQHQLTRSAIVVSWAGFFSVFCESIMSKSETDLRELRKNWDFKDSLDLKEKYPEAQIIDAAKEIGLVSNSKRRMLDGWLAQRNQCAHPTVYRPTINVGIGYVGSMIDETLHFLGQKP